jgi:hypothetical protein
MVLNKLLNRTLHPGFLFLTRLGEVEKALCHYNEAGKYTETKHIEQVEDVVKCLRRCDEARRSKEWNVALKETLFAISYGADSSPRVSFVSLFIPFINKEPNIASFICLVVLV